MPNDNHPPRERNVDRREFCKSTAVCGAVIAAGALTAILNKHRGVEAATSTAREAAIGAVSSARKPKVSEETCVSCRKCVRIAPKTFAMKKDTGKAYVKNATGDSPDVIEKAVKRCPVSAITYE